MEASPSNGSYRLIGSTPSKPNELVAFAWGSRSTSKTRYPSSANAAPRFTAVVVLPTPPFWLATARTRGSGRSAAIAATSDAGADGAGGGTGSAASGSGSTLDATTGSTGATTGSTGAST